jgi:hypothetical protein
MPLNKQPETTAPSRRCVVILDDTAARVTEMRAVLREVLPDFAIVAFNNAPDLIDWLPTGLAEAVLISLDHDLGPTRRRAPGPSGAGDSAAGPAERFDPGIGRDAADVLALYAPTCPVIVHSSNSLAVPGMLRVLRESGWPCSAVMPTDDLRWIPTDWRAEVEWWASNGYFAADR